MTSELTRYFCQRVNIEATALKIAHYLCLVWIRILRIDSLVDLYILKGFVHIAALAPSVSWEKTSDTHISLRFRLPAFSAYLKLLCYWEPLAIIFILILCCINMSDMKYAGCGVVLCNTKCSITQRLWTDLRCSLGVTTAIQLVWLNQFTGSQPSH